MEVKAPLTAILAREKLKERRARVRQDVIDEEMADIERAIEQLRDEIHTAFTLFDGKLRVRPTQEELDYYIEHFQSLGYDILDITPEDSFYSSDPQYIISWSGKVSKNSPKLVPTRSESEKRRASMEDEWEKKSAELIAEVFGENG